METVTNLKVVDVIINTALELAFGDGISSHVLSYKGFQHPFLGKQTKSQTKNKLLLQIDADHAIAQARFTREAESMVTQNLRCQATHLMCQWQAM